MAKTDITSKEEKPVCGIIRPISAIGDYPAEHWDDIAKIIDEVVQGAGLEANLVSEANTAGIIQARIVRNLYSNPVVICDVSGKNPNVMLELGMRLAFDKPVIVIKDDETDYSFDTSPIEHVGYPRSLHYGQINKFKSDLRKKLLAALSDGANDSSFLKQFGPIKVAEIDQEKVPAYEILKDEILEVKAILAAQTRDISVTRNAVAPQQSPTTPVNSIIVFSAKGLNDEQIERVRQAAPSLSPIDKVTITRFRDQLMFRVRTNSMDGWTREDAKQAFRDLLDNIRADA